MDILTGLLDGTRAREAFVLRCRLEPPFAIRIEDEAPIAVIAAVSGALHLRPEQGRGLVLPPGGVALVRGPEHYVVADSAVTEPVVVIHPGQRCTAPDGTELGDLATLGTRTWGSPGPGSTVFVTGVYERRAEVSHRLLTVLPHLVVLEAGAWNAPLLDYLLAEIDRDVPGQAAVLDRVVDLLLVAALREWLERPGATAPGWYDAQGDQVVGPVMRLIHDQPGRAWTLASLAAEVGWSRSTVAKRFAQLVGETPMTYLAQWRLDLAADLIAERGMSLDAVATRVGYGSGFALSVAFKRVKGVSPAEHRAARAGAARAPVSA
ncbi:MAG: AraC family transcriptional regulator [Lapillicoccus sp.]